MTNGRQSKVSDWPRWLLLAAILPASWLGMMAVHELGHVLAAWLTGAKIERVVLLPTAFSRTEVAGGGWSRVVVWMGPVVGVALPLLAWGIARLLRWEWRYILRFFAGVCLLANGAYLGSASFEPIGDAADLVRLGESVAVMTLFGCTAMIAALFCWTGLGPSFGFGKEARQVSPAVAVTVAVILVLGVAIEFLLQTG